MRPALGPLLFSFLLLPACGRKATDADCQLIIDRNVEVQLQALNVKDPEVIAKKQAEIREEPKTKEELKGCVGRRITDGMLACVKKAQTTTELESCMR